MARAKETVVTLFILTLMVMGMMYVISAIFDRDKDSIDRILSKYKKLKKYILNYPNEIFY